MKIEKAHIDSNAVGRGPLRTSPAFWPPPWLSALPKSPNISPEAVAVASGNPVTPPVVVPEPDEWDLALPVESIEPCLKCGSLETWWDCHGNPHCQQCEPIRRILALADLAARIRSQKP